MKKFSTFIDITDIEISPAPLHFNEGTGGIAPIEIEYQKLIELFGSPYRDSIDSKVKAEWVLHVKSPILEKPLVVTIYDYKSPINPEENTSWHVGGNCVLAFRILSAFLEEQE